MLILATEKRSSGHAYAALVTVTWRDERFTLILQRHPAGRRLWQTSLFQTPARITAESFTTPSGAPTVPRPPPRPSTNSWSMSPLLACLTTSIRS
jgi:hypothetical protein